MQAVLSLPARYPVFLEDEGPALFCCCLLCSAVTPPEMPLPYVSTTCIDLSQCLSSKKAVKISSKAPSLFDPSAVPHHWMDSEHRKQREAPGLRSPGYA